MESIFGEQTLDKIKQIPLTEEGKVSTNGKHTLRDILLYVSKNHPDASMGDVIEARKAMGNYSTTAAEYPVAKDPVLEQVSDPCKVFDTKAREGTIAGDMLKYSRSIADRNPELLQLVSEKADAPLYQRVMNYFGLATGVRPIETKKLKL